MDRVQKLAGVAALGAALTYIVLFVYYGAILPIPTGTEHAAKLAFMAEYKVTLSVLNFIGYILFGMFLAMLVQGLHQRLQAHSPAMIQYATIFGLIWVGIIITGGMFALLTLQVLTDLPHSEPEQVRAVWLTTNIVSDALGGGIELVGGIWVLVISIAGLMSQKLSKGINVVGLIVGSIGILTVFQFELLNELFGILQIVWFIWIGIHLLRNPQQC